jgi:DNA helicase MCM8
VELREDQVDTCIPGDIVTIAGVVKTISAEALGGRPSNRSGRHQSLYMLYIHANSIQNRRQADQVRLCTCFNKR